MTDPDFFPRSKYTVSCLRLAWVISRQVASQAKTTNAGWSVILRSVLMLLPGLKGSAPPRPRLNPRTRGDLQGVLGANANAVRESRG